MHYTAPATRIDNVHTAPELLTGRQHPAAVSGDPNVSFRRAIAEGAVETAHREIAQVIAALETERRLPAYLVPSLRRVETMLRADTIGELADEYATRCGAIT